MLCNFLQTSGTEFEHFRTDFAKKLTNLTMKLVKWARVIILRESYGHNINKKTIRAFSNYALKI